MGLRNFFLMFGVVIKLMISFDSIFETVTQKLTIRCK